MCSLRSSLYVNKKKELKEKNNDKGTSPSVHSLRAL